MNAFGWQTSPPFAATDELHLLLRQLGQRGYLVHSFRADSAGPEIVAATRDLIWPPCVNVLLLFDEHRACAYRTPTGPGVDVFAPHSVFWSYAANAVWTLRALFTLPEPGDPQAPNVLIEAPAGLGLPAGSRRSVRIRASSGDRGTPSPAV